MSYHRAGWLAGILLSGFMGSATAATGHHMLVAPQCLVAEAGVKDRALARQGKLYLLEADEALVNRLVRAKTASLQHKRPCGGFRDVTRAFEKSDRNPYTFISSHTVLPRAKNLDFSLQYPEEVNQLLSAINPQNMWTSLTTLSSFNDRYANAKTGVAAAEWIRTQVEAMAVGREDVMIYTVPTGGYLQPSVILRVGDAAVPGVVISGHMDTVSGWSWWGSKHMPGADDDGSGSVTVLEAARTVLASGMHFKKPIYFMWYAAEEEGLVGSGNVTRDFLEQNIPVEVALHFDMTGYAYRNDRTLWLLQDYTHPDVTAWLASMAQTYVKQTVQFTRCGYACSDHASWTAVGVAAGAATESSFANMNTSLHTSEDTMDKLSLVHMTDYLKLAVAFAVEAAVPQKS